MEPRQIPVSDGISRFLSLLAILLALASAVFLYQDNQRLKAELATIKGAGDPADFETHAKQWDTRLTSVLEAFKTRADEHVDKFDAAREARNRLANADRERDLQGLTADEVQKIVDDRIAVMKPAITPPLLQLARSVMKPTGPDDFVPARIANNGGSRAVIAAARFIPTPGSQFETDEDPSPELDEVVVKFSSRHNKPTKAGHHRVYERGYPLAEQVVAADGVVAVSVEISNDKHVGWGMQGDLELEYQDGLKLIVPAVRAVFVEEKVETT